MAPFTMSTSTQMEEPLPPSCNSEDTTYDKMSTTLHRRPVVVSTDTNDIDTMFTKICVLLTYRNWCNESLDRYVISSDIQLYIMKDNSIIVLQSETTKKQDISQIIEFLENMDAHNDRIVYSSISISRPALQYLQSFRKWNIEYIEFETYSFDRMSSALVPMYTLLTESEIRSIERKHVCSRDKWPKLLNTDPIVKYMGFKPEQCVSFGLDNEFRYIQ